MSSIEKFLRDQVEEARTMLDTVEAETSLQSLSPAIYAAALSDARKRLGDAVQANSAYLDERTSYLGQIEDLREDMKPIRIEAFAKERVKFYQKMAYDLTSAVEEAVESLSASIDESTAVSVREDLQKALEARKQASRTQR